MYKSEKIYLIIVNQLNTINKYGKHKALVTPGTTLQAQHFVITLKNDNKLNTYKGAKLR